jgi:hypothetical protein
MGQVPAHRKVDATPLLELIDGLRNVAGPAMPGHGWWLSLTGTTLQHTAWEKRIQRARARGWVDRYVVEDFCDEIIGQHPTSLYGDAWWNAA